MTVFCLGASTFGAESAGEHKKKKGQGDTAAAEESSKKPEKKPKGLFSRIWGGFQHEESPESGSKAAVERQIGKNRVQLSISLEPQPLKLSENRQMKVTLHVANRQKKLVQLEFPTTQRIEVLVKDKVGKLVEQWSEDRTFANEPGMVSINPGEHLEYSVSMSTRDMVAGQTYTVEALFPNYESLRLQQDIVAEK